MVKNGKNQHLRSHAPGAWGREHLLFGNCQAPRASPRAHHTCGYVKKKKYMLPINRAPSTHIFIQKLVVKRKASIQSIKEDSRTSTFGLQCVLFLFYYVFCYHGKLNTFRLRALRCTSNYFLDFIKEKRFLSYYLSYI